MMNTPRLDSLLHRMRRIGEPVRLAAEKPVHNDFAAGGIAAHAGWIMRTMAFDPTVSPETKQLVEYALHSGDASVFPAIYDELVNSGSPAVNWLNWAAAPAMIERDRQINKLVRSKGIGMMDPVNTANHLRWWLHRDSASEEVHSPEPFEVCCSDISDAPGVDDGSRVQVAQPLGGVRVVLVEVDA